MRAPLPTYDAERDSYRVYVRANGRRWYRRAKTLPEAMALRKALMELGDGSVVHRLRDGESKLDLTGLSTGQIERVLALIDTFGRPVATRETS